MTALPAPPSAFLSPTRPSPPPPFITSMFSSSPPLLNISFPDGLNHIFTASDVVQGGVSVRLETEDKGTQFKLDRVVAKLRVVQISTYYTRRANGAGHAGVGNRAGGSHVGQSGRGGQWRWVRSSSSSRELTF